MTLREIKSAAAAYLHRQDYEFDVNDVDLGLIALNQVRMFAEQTNDFNFTRKLVNLSVDGVTGGSLDDATDVNDAPILVKTVIDVGTFDSAGNLLPADWTTSADALNQQRQETMNVIPRYPTDAQVFTNQTQRFVFSGNNIYFFPKTPNLTLNVGVEAYTFTPDWTEVDLDDDTTQLQYSGPWLTRGAMYLMWSTVIHLNQLWRDFVFRQEGNLPPPEKLAEQALASLITWDTFQYEQFRRHHR